MSSDVDRRKLADISDNIALASAFLDGLTYDQFRRDTMRFYAVTRALEIISEASRKLSADLKARHPQIPWQDIAGAGNIYRHDYEDVLQQRVWNTVHEALPILADVTDAEARSVDQNRSSPTSERAPTPPRARD